MQNLSDYSNYVYAAYAISTIALATLFLSIIYQYFKVKKLKKINEK